MMILYIKNLILNFLTRCPRLYIKISLVLMLLKGRRRGDSWTPCIKKISKCMKRVFKEAVAPELQWFQGLVWHTVNRHELNLSTFQGGQGLVVNIMPSLNGKALPVTKYINLGLVLCWCSHMEFGQTVAQTVRLCLLTMYWQMNSVFIRKSKQKVFLHHLIKENTQDTLSKCHQKAEQTG